MIDRVCESLSERQKAYSARGGVEGGGRQIGQYQVILDTT